MQKLQQVVFPQNLPIRLGHQYPCLLYKIAKGPSDIFQRSHFTASMTQLRSLIRIIMKKDYIIIYVALKQQCLRPKYEIQSICISKKRKQGNPNKKNYTILILL